MPRRGSAVGGAITNLGRPRVGVRGSAVQLVARGGHASAGVPRRDREPGRPTRSERGGCSRRRVQRGAPSRRMGAGGIPAQRRERVLRPAPADRGQLATEVSILPPDVTDTGVLAKQLDRLRRDLDADPAAAIAHCKELIESQCKIVLGAHGKEYRDRDDLPELYRAASTALGIHAESVSGDPRGSERYASCFGVSRASSRTSALRAMQWAPATDAARPSPAEPRHARLVFYATVAITEFVAETWALNHLTGPRRATASDQPSAAPSRSREVSSSRDARLPATTIGPSGAGAGSGLVSGRSRKRWRSQPGVSITWRDDDPLEV